ncbi:MAG: aminotransferase class I/II-fold pyridoxal phosphate-dependent enzyme [Butyricimonas paravirosa]
MNIGQPDIQTPDVALQALKTCNEKVIEYTHSAGNISYRKKLAKYYQNIGINIDENNIMITTGGSEAITIAFMSTLNPGDEIIIQPFANYGFRPDVRCKGKTVIFYRE